MARMRPDRQKPDAWPVGLEEDVKRRLHDGRRIRRTLPRHGRLHIDRPLPFLCVHRLPVGASGSTMTRLVASEASYVICSARASLRQHLADLVATIVAELVEQFGTCLVLEMWEAPASPTEEKLSVSALTPAFRILAARGASRADVTRSLESELSQVRIGRNRARVVGTSAAKTCAGAMRSLLTPAEAKRLGCLLYGVEVDPVYRNPATGDAFPSVLRQFRRRLTVALRKAFFDFSRKHTTHSPTHYHSLGRRAVVKAVYEVDAILAEACERFDFLLQISPVNTEQAWHEFMRKRYDRAPALHYRPVPADPIELKRLLYKAPVERIEDPALALVFREKVWEVDRQITMLQDLNTPRCLSESVQLYGGVEEELRDEARRILEAVPPHSAESAPRKHVHADTVARRARQEIAALKAQDATLTASVEIREDIAGLIVSRGNLLVGAGVRVPESRLSALIQHEIGTHVVTYHNGRGQPFRLLCSGLAGYDQLQEGIAVLSEYSAGGLSRPRVQLLAARVIAVDCLVDGASFVETFRVLVDRHGLDKRVAFGVTTRVFRGGGFTKDAIYLRGFRQVRKLLGQGRDLRHLLVGKIAVEHIPIVRELAWRGVLKPPAILPGYLTSPEADARLERLKQSTTILDLLKRRR